MAVVLRPQDQAARRGVLLTLDSARLAELFDRARAVLETRRRHTGEQRDELLKLIDDTSTDVALFCRYYRIEAVPDLPASKFGSAKSRLEAKKVA